MILFNKSITLDELSPYRSPSVAILPTTGMLILRLARWADIKTTVRVVLILTFANGDEHKLDGQASGGERLGRNGVPITEYVLTWRPTLQFVRGPVGATFKTLIAQSPRCEARVELTLLSGISVSTMLILETK